MGRIIDTSEGSWRAALSDRLSWVALAMIAIANAISHFHLSASPRIHFVTIYVYWPLLVLLGLERLVRPRDYRIRAWLLIGTLVTLGLTGTAVVGLLAGSSGALFLALILTTLLFGQRAMFALLAVVSCGVGAIAWLMTHGTLAEPVLSDVSFAHARTWWRTAGNSLALLVIGAVVIAQVVKQLEDALARVKREAAELERAQHERTRALELALQAQKVEVAGRLATGLAHDLNNALFVIDACNQSLQRRKLEDAERIETHTAIAEAVKQSSSMARQLLAFARKHVATPAPLSTRELIDELSRSVPRLFPSDLNVELECEEDATLRADKVHLQQAILNLVINARDAMTSGGTVSVRAAAIELKQPAPGVQGPIPAGSYATIEVRDDGAGMDAATKARAFEPLFTTKPEGKGTGLGLASVQSTVEMSGGFIALWSEPGEGTRITLYFPRLTEVRAATPSAPRLTAAGADLRGLTVLLAEDSPSVRSVIAGALAQHGCTVLQARDGNEALAQIDRTSVRIDVLCTDAVMPGAPVRDVIARLHAKQPQARVLIISGYVADELTRRGIEQGHYRILAKPFETQRLLETLLELREQRLAS